MNIIFFAHPEFMNHQSMPRFVKMLTDGMQKRGHQVTVLSPEARFFNISSSPFLRKWLGYLDQYLVFPFETRRKLKKQYRPTLYVFTDHALGPWVPLVSDKPHVIHCHDFLAQQSAAALIPGNPVGYSGKLYQKYIRSGFLKGKNFISVSQKTKADLEENLPFKPAVSEVVYNGLNRTYRVVDNAVATAKLRQFTGSNINNGYILHIGGNQWYKNRAGLVEIYDAWRRNYKKDTALVLIGTAPDDALLTALQKSGYKNDIHLLTEAGDELVNIAYSGADVFLFPSKAEGFGWPIAEAMASGAPVITTDLAPMTEVGGDAAFFIPAKPYDESKSPAWAEEAAIVLEKVLTLSTNERNAIIKAGLENIKRFDTDKCLDKINEIYLGIMNETVVEHGNK